MEVFKLIAALLDYPTELTVELLDEISANPPASLSPARQRHLKSFVEAYRGMPLTQWQEVYVQLFDYSTPTSLNLFEHVHGSSKQRGMAMADLIDLYHSHGLDLANRELPDHLPVFLEFLSTLPPDEAMTYLAQIRPILESLQKTLRKASSPYSSLFSLL